MLRKQEPAPNGAEKKSAIIVLTEVYKTAIPKLAIAASLMQYTKTAIPKSAIVASL